jgi:hypothetical protein
VTLSKVFFLSQMKKPLSSFLTLTVFGSSNRQCSINAIRSFGILICFFQMIQTVCFAQTVTVTPAVASVSQGQSIVFTSNQPVSWSLVNGSSGTLIPNSNTSATYRAPNLVLPQGGLGGLSDNSERFGFQHSHLTICQWNLDPLPGSLP